MAEFNQPGLNWCIARDHKNVKYMNNIKLIVGTGLAYIKLRTSPK